MGVRAELSTHASIAVIVVASWPLLDLSYVACSIFYFNLQVRTSMLGYLYYKNNKAS
jgi:hypothetical protein